MGGWCAPTSGQSQDQHACGASTSLRPLPRRGGVDSIQCSILCSASLGKHRFSCARTPRSAVLCSALSWHCIAAATSDAKARRHRATKRRAGSPCSQTHRHVMLMSMRSQTSWSHLVWRCFCRSEISRSYAPRSQVAVNLDRLIDQSAAASGRHLHAVCACNDVWDLVVKQSPRCPRVNLHSWPAFRRSA